MRTVDGVGVRAGRGWVPTGMFFFFSNRLGCLGSLLLSAAITFVLFLLLSR